MPPAPKSFVSRKGVLGGYEVTGWRYVQDTAWHVKSAQRTRFPSAKAYLVRDGAFQPETTSTAEKLAILNLIAQWEARLPETLTDP
jgi:hypothetical protein